MDTLETKTSRPLLLQQLRHTQNVAIATHNHIHTLKSPIIEPHRPVHYSLTTFSVRGNHRQPRQLDIVETVTGVKITNGYSFRKFSVLSGYYNYARINFHDIAII